MTDDSLQLFIEAATGFVERRRLTNAGNKQTCERRGATPCGGSRVSDPDPSEPLWCLIIYLSPSTMFRWGVKGQQAQGQDSSPLRPFSLRFTVRPPANEHTG